MHRGLCRHYAPSLTGAVLLLLPLCVPAQPPQGGGDDQASLQTEVRELRLELLRLQSRLDSIEARITATPSADRAAPGATAPPAASRPDDDSAAATLTPQIVENWDALREGMEPQRVRTLLGAPSRDFKLGGQAVWYYHYTGVGGGSVMFSRGDGKVLSWQRPPFHGWW
ncbi:MAG: hypothetical protein ACWGNB_09195 [Thiogranum sp.]